MKTLGNIAVCLLIILFLLSFIWFSLIICSRTDTINKRLKKRKDDKDGL